MVFHSCVVPYPGVRAARPGHWVSLTKATTGLLVHLEGHEGIAAALRAGARFAPRGGLAYPRAGAKLGCGG